MIKDGLRASQIAMILNLDKQLVSYHIRRLKELGYVKEIVRDAFKLLELTTNFSFQLILATSC
jgi:DNA-binding CsgD family transcriptional regulator